MSEASTDFGLQAANVHDSRRRIAVIISLILMHALNLTSNIMSLGGIPIAIGAMVDAAIIMVENAHKRLEHWEERS